MKKILSIIFVFIMLFTLATMCVTAPGASSRGNIRNFYINGNTRCVVNYASVERTFLNELEENGITDYKIYDTSELTTEVLENRHGVTIVERCIGLVTNTEPGDEHGIILNTCNQEHNYIGYRGCAKTNNINEGTILVSYMIYNDQNNYIDDIKERHDFVLCREYED